MNNLSLALAAIGIALPLLAAIAAILQVWRDRRACMGNQLQLERMQLERMQLARIIVRNTRGTPMDFCLEPWGDACQMPADGWLRVEVTGPEDEDCLEVEIAETYVAVYGWSGSGPAKVFDKNGKVVARGCLPF
jgi:hypothetical protein